MLWKAPRIWEGEEVWIIGGGPSVTKQFGIPDKIAKQVVDGTLPPSIYSEYMSPIHDKHVIGINVAYAIGDWIDIVFFGDGSFFLEHQERLSNHPALKVSCFPNHVGTTWIKTLLRDTKTKGISTNPKTVCWNANSGAAAISLAAQMGAKRIILLGFDMKLNTDNTQHWHDLYGRKARINNPRDKKRMHVVSMFDKHLMGFPLIAKDAKQMGIEIINASPESTIEQFPKMTVSEILKKFV